MSYKYIHIYICVCEYIPGLIRHVFFKNLDLDTDNHEVRGFLIHTLPSSPSQTGPSWLYPGNQNKTSWSGFCSSSLREAGLLQPKTGVHVVFSGLVEMERRNCFLTEPRHQKTSKLVKTSQVDTFDKSQINTENHPKICNRATSTSAWLAWVALLMHLLAKWGKTNSKFGAHLACPAVRCWKISNDSVSKGRIATYSESLSCIPFLLQTHQNNIGNDDSIWYLFMLLPSWP